MQQVSAVVPDAARVPGATNGIASLFFTTQTPLLLTPASTVTVFFPTGFFAPAPAPAPTIRSQDPSDAFSTVAIASSLTSFGFVLTANKLLPPGAFNVTLSSITMGAAPMTAGCIGNLYAASSTDLRSSPTAAAGKLSSARRHCAVHFTASYSLLLSRMHAHAVASGRLGGQVQAVALVLGAAAGSPGTVPPGGVTISFTTQTALTNLGTIVISWPTNYIAPDTPAIFNIGYNGPANTFVTAAASSSASGATITVGTAGAPAGAYTISLLNAKIGLERASQGCKDGSPVNCVFVSTSVDRAGFASYPAIFDRGQVQAVSVSVLDADRLATGRTVTLTVTFTTQTDLGLSAGAVTM